MFDKKFRKRTAAGGMAAVMLFSGLLSSAAYARDGWTETQFLNNPVEVRMREFSFSDKANQQALAAGSIPTGLGHELRLLETTIFKTLVLFQSFKKIAPFFFQKQLPRLP